MKSALKKINNAIDRSLVFLELNLPAIFMICLFGGFVVAVCFRYLFNLPLAKVEEGYVIAFCWMALFSAPLAIRDEEHLCFTILYDALREKGKAVIDVLGKVILLVLLIVLIKPSWETVIFYGITRTSMLRMSYTYLYAPFMFYLLATIYHQLILVIRDIGVMLRVFRGEAPTSEKEGKS